MALKYFLVENHFNQDDNAYVARTLAGPSYDLSAMVDRTVLRGSTLTRADMLAGLTLFFSECEQVTLEGGHLNLPILNTSFSIPGNFIGPTDGFDSTRHHVNCNATAGPLLKEAATKVKVQKVVAKENIPHVLEVTDNVSGSINQSLTPNGVLTVAGNLLKVVGDDATIGAYFVKDDGTETKVETLVDNKPSRLIVLIPALEAGDYHLVIRTQYAVSAISKKVRTGTFDHVLSVA